jgi:DNA-binding transcriptional MocR family regulator
MIDLSDIAAAGRQPKYKKLSDRLANAIRSGELANGTRLPSHRDLAYQLGISIASVARAYNELADEGLVRGEIGRGTVVHQDHRDARLSFQREQELIDLSLVVAPAIEDQDLSDMAGRKTLRALSNQWAMLSSTVYPSGRGEPRHRRAAVNWLSRRDVPVSDDTVGFTVGAQEAVASALSALTRQSKTVLAENLTIVAIRNLAGTLGLDLHPVAMDDEGICPDDLRRRARQHHASVVILQPTMQQPRGTRMTEARRRQIADVAREEDLFVIEYESWSAVVDLLGPPLAALAPERCIYVDAFSTQLSPTLRTGLVRLPEQFVRKFEDAHHALVLATPPLGCEIATYWITSGIADRLASAVRATNARRMHIAQRTLGPLISNSAPTGPIIWLSADRFPSGDALASKAQEAGVKIQPASRFATGREIPTRARASLTFARSDDELVTGLQILSNLLDQRPSSRAS